MSMVNISFIDSLSSSPHTLNFTPMLQVAKDVTPKFIYRLAFCRTITVHTKLT